MAAKDGVNTQWGLASSDGTRESAGAAFPLLGNGEGGPPLIDLNGNVWVRPVGPAPPEPGFDQLWQANTTFGLVADAQIRGTADPANQFLLQQVTGFIEAPSDTDVNYVQLFNLTGAPVSGVTHPEVSIRIVGSQNYAWAPGRYRFPNGIFWAISTTPNVYTSGTTAAGLYNALGWESLP